MGSRGIRGRQRSSNGLETKLAPEPLLSFSLWVIDVEIVVTLVVSASGVGEGELVVAVDSILGRGCVLALYDCCGEGHGEFESESNERDPCSYRGLS